jgi:ribosomal protein S18 acetylase RimI-like enzyme
MSLFIRSLTVEDFDVADTILTLAYNTKGSLRGELERFFSLQSDSCWLLVTLDDVSVGLGGVVDYGAYAYIGLVAIHPEAQRLGLGDLWLDYCIGLKVASVPLCFSKQLKLEHLFMNVWGLWTMVQP